MIGKRDKRAEMPKALLVEDHPDHREILRQQLELLGYGVTTTAAAPEALVRLENERPDVLVLDIMMPELDGCEISRTVRGLPDLSDLPILAVTVLASEKEIQECFEAGCTAVLTKPVKLDDLQKELKRLTGAGRGER
jgi:CheY-like chemotaxis protein